MEQIRHQHAHAIPKSPPKSVEEDKPGSLAGAREQGSSTPAGRLQSARQGKARQV